MLNVRGNARPMKIKGFLFSSDFYHMPFNQGDFVISDDFRKKQRLKFLQNIAEKKMQYESVSCLCSNDDFEVLTTMDRHNLPQMTSLCTQCGLMLNNPRLDEASYNFLYTSGMYRDLYVGEEVFVDKESPTVESYSQIILEFLKKNDPGLATRKKVLEIGCHVGKTLYGLKKEGFDVAGIEPDARACEIGNAYDLNIKCGLLEDFTGKNEFDLIIMTEVFEHLLYPEKALNIIKRLLKPEGVVYISVIGVLCPALRNIKKFTQVAHPYNFSLNTLSMVLGAHGFSLVAGNEGIQAFFVKSDSAPNHYAPDKKNFEAIRNKFFTLHLNNQKWSYRVKEKFKAFIRETLKYAGLFNVLLAGRDRIRQLLK